ncbi:capsular polysaccharide synthesis protein [Leuconostoc mesenteroides]|uniref:capsular polysaccharide synthesis protein n=1 Tax=Leuconostoc mesenteroides TaxID=1245 RepID=UPI002360D58F|nr:capsular polysaccharide synthesis protein [Leuconostoc mesenteroides]
MKKIIKIVRIFKVRFPEYIFCKITIYIFRHLNKYSTNHPNFLVRNIRTITNHTDRMVQEYIFSKYNEVFKNFENVHFDKAQQPDKIIWTAWFQGESNAPISIQYALESIKRHAKEYRVIVITNANLKNFIDIPDNIESAVQQKKISLAHYADWIRLKLLSEYGGVWLDATSYMVKPLPEKIWQYDLLTWNEMIDFTGDDIYAGIPFVEYFNNGFLVAKKNSTFYRFAVEITEKLLMDPILTVDYFANFKAYLVAFEKIPLFQQQRELMKPIAENGFLVKQYWNSPIENWIKLEFQSDKTIFFNLIYKELWNEQSNGQETVQQFLINNY